MKVANSILELIGKTPLVKLTKLDDGLKANLFLKLESFNPGGSIKDRIALNLIEDAEKKSFIDKETTIVEPTSGNTGIGLALVCAVKGYSLILTMPDTMSIERQQILKAYGAELVLTPGKLGMNGAISKAEDICKKEKKSFMPQQFKNPANPEIHEKTTALEIWRDTDGEIDILVSGVGTGGTITGISRVLKEKRPSFKAIAVEPVESAVLSGENPGPHKIQGIGAGFIPDVLDTNLIDEIIKIDHIKAREIAKNLAKKEGILVGISSGAALWAALEVAKRKESKGKNIVVILPDTGERYLSTWLFNL